jgi:hypothetical protein
MHSLIEICRQEFGRATKAVVAAYSTLKEIDARTMAILIAVLRR